MMAKEVWQDKTATAADFAKTLCELARENLVGLVATEGNNEFVFSLPGNAKVFRVRVIEE
ncbi:MAG: hypothetical protein IJY63_00215 [Clostridia bacterium]|nr:hypothetical protein [Clostridia bacterium]MBQ8875954.1 hypothetical protein [Clostridia bacterium]